MTLRKTVLAAACFALFAFVSSPIFAQSVPLILPGGCGTANFVTGSGYLTVDSTGKLCTGGTGSGGSIPVTPGALTPLTPMQTALGIASATTLTPAAGATYAVVCARSANANYSTDGTTTPTATVGMQLLQSQCLPLQGATTIANFKAIQQSATATLDISYFK